MSIGYLFSAMKRSLLKGLALVALTSMGSVAAAQTAVPPAGSGTEADPYQITVLGNLVWMSDTVTSSSGSYYKLMNDIDASETAAWDSGKGFLPIGNVDASFEGTFDGNNKKITNLTINRTDMGEVGLFKNIVFGSAIKNLGLEDFTIAGREYCGSLVGWQTNGSISNCYSIGTVSGTSLGSGGLVGYQHAGSISNCYVAGTVTGKGDYCGGLLGFLAYGSISNCYSDCNVSGISKSYYGGLVGYVYEGSISNCYSVGSVSGTSNNRGGLVGYLNKGSISNCYSAGSVSGGGSCGGLVGYRSSSGTVSDSYYDTETSGQSDTGKGTPKTTAEMKQQATFSGWDFASIWGIKENQSYPYLLSLTSLGSLQVTLLPAEAVTAGARWSVDGGVTWNESGTSETVTGLTTHTVTYKKVFGYTTPPDEDVYVDKDTTATVTGIYEDTTGSLVIDFIPPVPGGAAWSVDGGATWYDGGTTVTLESGDVALTFKPVNDWDAPADTTVTVVKGVESLYEYAYNRHVATLMVMTAGAAGEWTVDGGATWHTSGTVLTLPVGDYTVSFSDVTYFTTPADYSLTLVKDAAETYTGTYTRKSSRIGVDIFGNAAGRWSIDGGTTWNDSGTTLTVDAGAYTVTFLKIYSWAAPASVDVDLLGGEEEYVTGTYIFALGGLLVNIEGTDEGRWSIDGGATWNEGGTSETVTGLTTHTVTYKKVFGYTTPPDEDVYVDKDTTVTVTGIYEDTTGSLVIDFIPPVPGGAAWSVDGGATWYDGGTTVTLESGDVALTFKPVNDWDAPADTTVTVVKGAESLYEYAYNRHVATLTVMTAGAAGEWTVDGGATWHTSGTVLTLPVGDYTVSFSDVTYFTTPADHSLTLVKDAAETYTGTYTRKSSRIGVDIFGNAAGRWSIDGGTTWNEGGTTLTVDAAAYTVTFLRLDGWATPASVDVDLLGGEEEYVTGTYIIALGGLLVNIEGTDEGRWSIDGGATWREGGTSETVSGLTTHTVTYKKVFGYTTPPDEDVYVDKDTTVTVTGIYEDTTGSLVIDFIPPVPGGAAWSVDGGATWYDGGTTVTLESGDVALTFKPVSGWEAPADTTVTVVKGVESLYEYAYNRHVATLTVMTAGAAGTWTVDGGATWHASGTVLTLPAGDYTISFSDVTYFTTPADHSLTLVKDAAETYTGTYTRKSGTLTGYIYGNDAGRWSIDGGTTWNESGTTLTVDANAYTVTFKDVEGYYTPAAQNVEVLGDDAVTVSGIYTQITGGLLVNIIGTDEGRWSIDGGATWREGGTSETVAVTTYTVTYKKVYGFETPADEEVYVDENTTATVTGTYVDILTTLTVNIIGPSAARWSLDGGTTWHGSGASVTVEEGNYTVTFNDVSSWDTPAAQSVTLVRGESRTLTATYTRHTGTLTVTIVGPATGAWSIDNGVTWNTGTSTVSNINTGVYTLRFRDVADWYTPANQTVTITKNGTTTATGTYTPHKGTLIVDITGPPAGAWSIDGGATWHGSGVSLSLMVGTYTITYKTVTGWTAPTDTPVVIRKDVSTTIARAYTRDSGTLTVTILPAEAVAAGARWSVDGGATWHESGAIRTLDTETYTITFKEIADWYAPQPHTVTVTKDAALSYTGTYVNQVGALQVTITEPAEGRWSIDGGTTWKSSGVTVNDLPVGSYTLTFKAVDGWDTPKAQTVAVTVNRTTKVTVTYQRSCDIVLTDSDFSVGVNGAIAPGTAIDMTWSATATKAITDPIWLEIFASKTGGFDMTRLGVAATASYKAKGMDTAEVFAPDGLTLNPIADGMYTLMPSINRGTIKDAVHESFYGNNWNIIPGKRLTVCNKAPAKTDLQIEYAIMIIDTTDQTSATIYGTIYNAGPAPLTKPGCWVEGFYGTLTSECVLMAQGAVGAGVKFDALDVGESKPFELQCRIAAGCRERAVAVIADSTDIVPETNEANNTYLLFQDSNLPAPVMTGVDLTITAMAVDPMQCAPKTIMSGTPLNWAVEIRNKGTVMPAGQVYLELFASQDGGATVVRGRTLTWGKLITPPAIGETKIYHVTEPTNNIGNGLYTVVAMVNRTGVTAEGNIQYDDTPLDNIYRYADGRISLSAGLPAGDVDLMWSQGPFFEPTADGKLLISGTIVNTGTAATNAFWTEAFYGSVQAKTGYFFIDKSKVFSGGQYCPGLAAGATQDVHLMGTMPKKGIVGILIDSMDNIPETDETNNYDYQ